MFTDTGREAGHRWELALGVLRRAEACGQLPDEVTTHGNTYYRRKFLTKYRRTSLNYIRKSLTM